MRGMRLSVVLLMLALCQVSWAFLGGDSSQEQWLHSLPKRCLLQRQSHFDQSIVVKAEQGDYSAQYQLGMALFLGGGLPKDESQAFQWFQSAAKAGHVRAQVMLAAAYLHGVGTNLSKKDAAYWFQKAADQDDDDARFALALMMWRGEGIDQDQDRAKRLLVDLAGNNNASAQGLLGELLLSQAQGDDLKMQEAITWFKRAVDNGMQEANYFLILAHIQASPSEPVAAQDVMWLTEGAHQGEVRKQYLLGMMYRYGVGVTRNLEMAKDWLSQAAQGGDESAQILLGTF